MAGGGAEGEQRAGLGYAKKHSGSGDPLPLCFPPPGTVPLAVTPAGL